MIQPLEWGILGTGKIARKFAAQLPQTARAKLTAVGSRSADAASHFADEFGARSSGHYDEVLEASGVEAVYISLPNALHHPWTIRALQAGKHVLCEKPIAVNAAEAEEMFDAAEQAGRLLVEAFMYRAHPAIARLIAMVHDGAIGQLKLIRTHFTYNRPNDLHDIRFQKDLAGGALMDVGCYCINFARALAAAEPTSMHASAHVHATGVDDCTAGVLAFEDRTFCSFTCGMTVDSDRTSYLCGSDGHIVIRAPWFCDGTFEIVKDSQHETIKIEAPMDLYALEAEAFAAAVQDGAEPWLTKADTLGNIRVLDQLRSQIGLPY